MGRSKSFAKKASKRVRQVGEASSSIPASQPSSSTRVPLPSNQQQLHAPTHSLLQFPTPEQQSWCATLYPLPIHPSFKIVYNDLHAIGLSEPIMGMIDRSKWGGFLSIDEPVFRELFVEFLSTFQLVKSSIDFNKPEGVSFRLGRKHFNFTLHEFAEHCGFYEPVFATSTEIDNTLFDFGSVIPRDFWGTICNVPSRRNYDPRLSKSTSIASPALRYLHRLIAFTICGRKESTGVVSLRDLFYLHCFVHGRVPHLGYGFALYMEGMARKKKGALCGGSYVTHLAKKLGVFDQCPHLIQICNMLPFSLTVMRKIRLLDVHDAQSTPIASAHLGDTPDRPQSAHTPPPSYAAGPSHVPSAGHYDLTLQYHSAMLAWLSDGVSTLCQFHGLPLPSRPVFPSSATATEELHDVDSADDTVGGAPSYADDDTPFDD